MRRVGWWIAVVVLAAATVAAVAVGGRQALTKSRQLPPVADQADARQTAMDAASAGTVKILTYSPATFDQDVNAAKACLTGDFLSYYDQFTRDVVAPAARDRGLTTTATIARAGVEAMSNTSAAVLVFITQTTRSTDQPEPKSVSSAARVGLRKVQSTWLIDQFNPV